MNELTKDWIDLLLDEPDEDMIQLDYEQNEPEPYDDLTEMTIIFND